VRITEFKFSAKVGGRRRSFGQVAWEDGEIHRQGFTLRVTRDTDLAIEMRRDDGQPMEIDWVSYEFELPLLNFGKVIVPDCGRFYMRTMLPRQVWSKTFSLRGDNFGNPFLALLDNFEGVELAMGLLGPMMEAEFRFLSPGANRKNSLRVDRGMLRFEINKPPRDLKMGTVDVFRDVIFQTEGDRTWFHALRRYAKHYWDRRGGFEFKLLDEAFRPAFCTWVSYNSDTLNHDFVVEMAKRAAALNMKSFILDDGWYGTGLDGESMISNMGDWPRSNHKFPDIRKTMKAIQSEGLLAILWYGPVLLSPDAEVFPRAKHLCVDVKGKPWKHVGNFHAICPRNPEARELMIRNAERLMSHGADGLKIDLLDYVPEQACTADHEHDVGTVYEGMTRLCSEMCERVLKINPRAWFGEKNNFGNVEFASHATTLRGGDSPFDININQLRVAYPAAYAPAVHNDYLVWTFAERPRDLALLLIKHIVGGVPNFAVDVFQLPEEQAEVVRAWLGFFNRNVGLYRRGVFEPQDPALNVWQRVDRTRAMVTLLHPAREARLPDRRKIMVLNATGRGDIHVIPEGRGKRRVTALDHRLKKIDTREITLRKGTLRVPVAGMVVIEK
jgi:alpha-galactosidase